MTSQTALTTFDAVLPADFEKKAANTIRMLAADGVQAANSGHPGMPMGMALPALTLWTRFMRYNPANPDWANRDRFVLSAGHGSMLLYTMLHLTGYDLPLDELRRFRQWGTKTPGHPEVHHTGRGDHHRPAWGRVLQRRGHGDRRAVAGPALQPPRL